MKALQAQLVRQEILINNLIETKAGLIVQITQLNGGTMSAGNGGFAVVNAANVQHGECAAGRRQGSSQERSVRRCFLARYPETIIQDKAFYWFILLKA